MTTHLALVDGRMRDTTSGHLTSEHLAAFLDGRLTGAERERAVRHFASCAECREELTELRDVLDAPRATGSRRWVAVAAAAAAIVAFAMIPRMVRESSPDGAARVRGSEAIQRPDGPSIEIVSPTDRSQVTPTGLELSWRALGSGATYTVTVQDTTGSDVWSVSDTTTRVALPDTVRLQPGHRYFWSVDARLADGTTAKTRVYSFIIR